MNFRMTSLITLFLATPAVAHEPLDFLGSEVHIVLDSEGSGGSLGMFAINQPDAGGPPRHIHEDADEAFFIVDGEFEILAGDTVVVATEGEAAFAPKGAVHTFRSTREEGGTILVIVTPAGFEGFFRKVVEEGITPADNMERFLEISEEFQQRMSGPPLGME